MEGLHFNLFLKTFAIILLLSQVSGRNEGSRTEEGNQIRSRRGIGSTVAQIFFGGRPADSYAQSHYQAPDDGYQQQRQRRENYYRAQSKNYRQDSRQQSASSHPRSNRYQNGQYQQAQSSTRYRQSQSLNRPSSSSSYDYNSQADFDHQRLPYKDEDEGFLHDSESVTTLSDVRRPVSTPVKSPFGSSYMNNFVRGHEHFKDNFMRGHEHFKDSFVRGHEHLKYNFMKGHEHLTQDFVRGHEQLKEKVASYWKTFMPLQTNAGRQSDYGDNNYQPQQEYSDNYYTK